MENYGSYLFGPTLRDLLAMAALSSDTFISDDPKVWAAKARRAYGQADAMLSERDKVLASGEAVVEVQSTGNTDLPMPMQRSIVRDEPSDTEQEGRSHLKDVDDAHI